MTAKSKEAVESLLQKLFELIAASGAEVNPTQFVEKLERITQQLPDQFMALNNLERFLTTTPSSASILSDFSKNEKLLVDFLMIVSTSEYLADILVRHPSYFRYLFSPIGIETQLNPQSLQEELARQVSIYKEISHKGDFIRRIYKREILRIGARDICGMDDIENTTRQISQLAESILKIYFDIAAEGFAVKRGVSPPPICCIGLGKLGGNELNYSSDIDLLFLHAEPERNNEFDAAQHANYFVGQLIKYLTIDSAEGHLYRVDLRLRPDGSAGAAAQSLNGAIAYYESRGELWERQMLIKARHVAGDATVSDAFFTQMRSFVYPRTWLENPIDEIPRMKIRIEAVNSNEFNVKLRRGGIRDIEFIVQALQLLNGGSCPEIQAGNTLHAISALEKNKILTRQEASLLSAAYEFFRLVEHRLQLLMNLQTHTIPSDAVEFRNLSKRCGYKNERKFRNELFGYFDAVSGLFNNVFRIEQPIERTEIEQLMEGSIKEDRTRRVLENYGMSRIEEGYRNVQFLSRGITRAGDMEFPAGITKAFREIAPDLFEDIKLTVDQDLTLKNLSLLVSAIKSVEVFYKSLSNENFRRLILTLCAKATRFVNYLIVDPLLLDMTMSYDRLVDPEIYFSDSLPLSAQKKFNEIKLGLLYLLGEISLHEMQARWTMVAEAFFVNAFEKTFPSRRPIVIAGGKFGSGEMSFMSDVDVIFILPDKLKQSKPAIEKKIPDIQKKLLDENGSQILTVDLKLRPEGRSAPLLMTESEYETYLKKRLSIWEVMAMTRFRNTSDAVEINRAIGETIRNFKMTPSSLEEIAGLYNKIIQSKKYFDEMDVKSGDGGIFAIEFLVQTLVLKNPNTIAGFLPCKIVDLIDRLKEAGTLSDEVADEIKGSYEFYRMIEFSNYVSLSKMNHKIPHDERDLASLSAHLDFKNAGEFLDSLKSRMRRISSLFRKVISDSADTGKIKERMLE